MDLAPAMIEMDFGQTWPGAWPDNSSFITTAPAALRRRSFFDPHGVDHGGETASALNLSVDRIRGMQRVACWGICTTCRHVWSFLSNVEGNNFGE